MLTTDVKELNDPSAAMKSASDKLLHDVDNALYQSVEKIAEELKNQGEELGKELEDGLKDIINEMNIK
jgi:DNA-directed RNA polymerase alpha subunit